MVILMGGYGCIDLAKRNGDRLAIFRMHKGYHHGWSKRIMINLVY